jgi:tRNA (guanine-N7-)-methyltransferase
MTENNDDLTHRRIRSFVLRQGRLTKGQERALETGWPKHGVEYASQSIDVDVLFDRKDSKKILEIGFGMGDATAKIAQTLPDCDFIAVEVHTPGVGSLLKLIEESALSNIRIIQHDAVEVLQNMLPDQSLDGVHIFFPDPWHKKRHHKRRLIQAAFVKLLCEQVKSRVHTFTWQPIGKSMQNGCLKYLMVKLSLKTLHKIMQRKPSYRPLTKFENRGIKLGHGVWDIVFIRK